MEEMEEKKIAYYMLEAHYIKLRGGKVTYKTNEKSDLFPADWYGIMDYKKKIEILNEAIEKNCLIIQTSGYVDLVNDVKRLDIEEEK